MEDALISVLASLAALFYLNVRMGLCCLFL